MKFKYSVCFVLLWNMSCTAKTTLENSTKLETLAEKKNELQKVSDQNQIGIEIIEVTEEWAENMGLIDMYRIDPGFAKWCVIFYEIPGNPPYSFQQKRLIQLKHDSFYQCPSPSPEGILQCKNSNSPTAMIVSSRGFLPGENITVRLSAEDTYREITFCPRPILMKKKTGELLAKATLRCMSRGSTFYEINICGVENQEKYKLASYSGDEILSHPLQGPMTVTISPEVIGMDGDIAKIVLQFEDGNFYSMELPWGTALFEYGLGKK